MFNKTKWLVLIVIPLLCAACDLESDTQGNGVATLSPPTNVRAVAVSPTSISVTWNIVSGATSYDVYFETGNMPITRVNTVTGLSYTHTGLQTNATYHYYIAAKNRLGTSDYSSRTSATTQPK